ncbi:MAG: cupin domain-containing protein [Candidatus Kerfeldbacteria bacterium]|nr:cupin domain-containing protein [Candidatus Kerfeldbacteria bacterium]
MYYSQQDAQEFTIPGGTHGYLYPTHPKGEQSIAYIEMDGVYPEAGYSRNDRCTETIYVLEGEMEIEYQGQWHTLKPHDLLMIEPENKYRSRGCGKAMVVITPGWDKSQNHIIQ